MVCIWFIIFFYYCFNFSFNCRNVTILQGLGWRLWVLHRPRPRSWWQRWSGICPQRKVSSLHIFVLFVLHYIWICFQYFVSWTCKIIWIIPCYKKTAPYFDVFSLKILCVFIGVSSQHLQRGSRKWRLARQEGLVVLGADVAALDVGVVSRLLGRTHCINWW